MCVLINIIKTERADPLVWTEVYEREKKMATEFVIEPRRPRTTGRQRHRENVQGAALESYWQRAVYFPLIDHLIQNARQPAVTGGSILRTIPCPLKATCMHSQATFGIRHNFRRLWSSFCSLIIFKLDSMKLTEGAAER